MAIGLVAVLVTLGVIVVIMWAIELPSAQNAASVQKKVKPKVEQIAGHGADGTNAADSVQVRAQSNGGRLNSVIVTDVAPGGAMEKYFGLKKGDQIIEIAPQGGVMMPVSDMQDAGNAKDQLLSAYPQSQQITVMRDGQKLTLPAAPSAKPAGGAGAATPTAGGSDADALQKQLQGITAPR
jgi:hypothetical protein